MVWKDDQKGMNTFYIYCSDQEIILVFFLYVILWKALILIFFCFQLFQKIPLTTASEKTLPLTKTKVRRMFFCKVLLAFPVGRVQIMQRLHCEMKSHLSLLLLDRYMGGHKATFVYISVSF